MRGKHPLTFALLAFRLMIVAHRTSVKILSLVLLSLVFATIFAGCVGSPPVQAAGPSNVRQSLPTATPTPSPTPSSTSTQATGPTMPKVDVEYAVFSTVSACADGLAAGGKSIRTALDSSYEASTRTWTVDAFTSDGNVTLGIWSVEDRSTLPVTPLDSIAQKISSGKWVCSYPPILLDGEATPPQFLSPSQVPPGQQPSSLIGTANLAEMRVWATVYSCYQDFPALSDFTAMQDVGGKWLVEGHTSTTSYGIWQVDAQTGAVSPFDDRAKQVSSTCNSSGAPVALTAQQASVRVWVATADCFAPSRPPLSVFTATQETPDRWVVEGRQTSGSGGGTLYGLWLVEANTGQIQALDNYAQTIMGKSCFQGNQ